MTVRVVGSKWNKEKIRLSGLKSIEVSELVPSTIAGRVYSVCLPSSRTIGSILLSKLGGMGSIGHSINFPVTLTRTVSFLSVLFAMLKLSYDSNSSS